MYLHPLPHKRKKNKVSILLLLLTLFFVSCNKSLDVPSSRVAAEKQQWTSINDVRSSLFGIYGLFRATLAQNNAYWLWGDLREGDFVSFSRPDLKAIIEGKLNSSYSVIDKITDWKGFYSVINACNLFLERSGEALQDKRYTELNHKVDIAQVRSLRAFAYFLMVRIWGDVPLLVYSHDGTSESFARTSKKKVLNFCENELIDAAKDLPYRYGLDDPQQPGNYYGFDNSHYMNSLFTKLAAYALLAHVSAWQGHYYDVANYTQFILQNADKEDLYYTSIEQLIDPDGIFNNQDPAQLLGFNFSKVYGEFTTNGHIEQLTLAAPLVTKLYPDIYIPKDTILAAFPASNGNDIRFGIDSISGAYRENYFTNFKGEMPIFSKIKVINGGVQDPSFPVFSSAIIFTRLEEITLLRAEALAILSNNSLDESNDYHREAIKLLNIIKNNRNVNAYIDRAHSGNLITAIFDERRRELMGEGWRWYDLIRYYRIMGGDSKIADLIDNGGIYWPISQNVLKRNSLLVQNKYWTK